MDDRLEAKFKETARLYAVFDKNTADYRNEAACKKGCAYCCTDAGSIDITTLKNEV